jgi:hypothetical protein
MYYPRPGENPNKIFVIVDGAEAKVFTGPMGFGSFRRLSSMFDTQINSKSLCYMDVSIAENDTVKNDLCLEIT